MVEDVADPVLGPGDVLVSVKACGICGSDLHALHYADELVAMTREMGMPIAFDPTRDFIMGHEFTGEVVESAPHHGQGRAGAATSCNPAQLGHPDALMLRPSRKYRGRQPPYPLRRLFRRRKR